MSAPTPDAAKEAAETPAKKSGRRKLLILIAAPVVLLLAGAALWFTGVLPHLLGMEKPKKEKATEKKPEPPTFVDLPEMVANLNSNTRRPSYIKLVARVEVPKTADVAMVKTAIPRLQDVMQTYLREMRPEELRGSAGIYRLREELLNRANAAVAPATISDVLFTEMLIQ
ncbi:MAG TPA: flagellar basal body-associated FliL family protein [Rhodopila sp.]|nr:flagellar basal body-associated FliL family protein [Rhodopila sp.]